ncbi:MAG: bifunctional oligoribonuclease/PAP phosphatase NrnA [Clostridiales bacterium]|nr:bifunctional oligoribonuclease/PAP phosphatase NrnA [Clostridiales bacterium]
MNHDWSRIIEELNRAEKILCFTHVNMDGDAMGSAVALCRSMRLLGKRCYILLEDEIPDDLAFLDPEGCFVYESPGVLDLAVALDCADASRLENRKDIFYTAPLTISIDHHLADSAFTDLEVRDTEAAATASLVFELLKEMGAPIDKNIAENIYAAILTDTGRFCYSNCDAKTHEDVAELYKYGIDQVMVCANIYDELPEARLKLESLVIERMERFAGGLAAISYCTDEDLERLGATQSMSEYCSEKLRSVQGVEMSGFLKQRGENKFKASLRSKNYANVNAVASAFGGGGHQRASGCTIYADLDSALKMLKEEMERHL